VGWGGRVPTRFIVPTEVLNIILTDDIPQSSCAYCSEMLNFVTQTFVISQPKLLNHRIYAKLVSRNRNLRPDSVTR